MTLREAYEALGSAARLSQARADEIVAAARPLALSALGRGSDPPAALDVKAVEVDPAVARGGSLMPAWPGRAASGSVSIEFVADWGAMLVAWRNLLRPEVWLDELLLSGQRIWIGISNDVLQMFVPDPPTGCYSMVRHHALMLVAATLWLGPDSTQRWRNAHTMAARAFLRDLNGQELWSAIDHAEKGLDTLLADPRARQSAVRVVGWLEADPEARTLYQAYLGAASLGVAALLESEPVWTPRRLTSHICHQHRRADFNRVPIERFAKQIGA